MDSRLNSLGDFNTVLWGVVLEMHFSDLVLRLNHLEEVSLTGWHPKEEIYLDLLLHKKEIVLLLMV